MACFHPLRAWRARSGVVSIAKEMPDAQPLHLPCGGCLGCRMERARSWALRCKLELEDHDSAVFTTLTYAPETEPVTLQKSHLQRWLKRFRKAVGPNRTIRFFASGEYGEKTQHPHYHAILFGASVGDADLVDETWGLGFTQTKPVNARNIAYTAGYTSKKIGYLKAAAEERIDLETGEVYHWQPPFIQMSRRPGLGATARNKYRHSWRAFAVYDGTPIPVPRYLHEAWKTTATKEDQEQLMYEKSQLSLSRDKSKERLRAKEEIAMRKQEISADKRKL